jgi:hypothetical protein
MTTLHHPSGKAGKAAPDSAAARALDEALDETFPASDPIAVTPDASEAQKRDVRSSKDEPSAHEQQRGRKDLAQ